MLKVKGFKLATLSKNALLRFSVLPLSTVLYRDVLLLILLAYDSLQMILLIYYKK